MEIGSIVKMPTGPTYRTGAGHVLGLVTGLWLGSDGRSVESVSGYFFHPEQIRYQEAVPVKVLKASRAMNEKTGEEEPVQVLVPFLEEIFAPSWVGNAVSTETERLEQAVNNAYNEIAQLKDEVASLRNELASLRDDLGMTTTAAVAVSAEPPRKGKGR